LIGLKYNVSSFYLYKKLIIAYFYQILQINKMQLSILKRITLRLNALKYSFSRNIKIGSKTHVYPGVRIETRYGGKIEIGKESEILDGVLVLTYGGDIKIGNFCSINPYTIIYGHGGTTIGNNVLIAGHCMIIPGNHNFLDCDIPIGRQGHTAKGIVIGDDVWISHGCSILDGVTIGKGSIIGAGSVVTSSLPPYSIAVGVPAKIKKNRKDKS
jgi:acetyltransferase-like isoleucine patch superfamily enzyme